MFETFQEISIFIFFITFYLFWAYFKNFVLTTRCVFNFVHKPDLFQTKFLIWSIFQKNIWYFLLLLFCLLSLSLLSLSLLNLDLLRLDFLLLANLLGNFRIHLPLPLVSSINVCVILLSIKYQFSLFWGLMSYQHIIIM